MVRVISSAKRVAAPLAGGVFAAALVVAALSPIAPTANAAGTWAAIAFSPETGSYGYSYNASSKDEGDATAMDFCFEYGGTDCQVAASAATGCLALADSPTHWAGGLGATKADAEADALFENGGGRIVVSGCTGA